MIMSPEISRVYERSSAYRHDCKAGAKAMQSVLWALREQIETEERDAIEAIRSRQDADDYEKELRALTDRQELKGKVFEELDMIASEEKGKSKKVEKPALPVGVEMPPDKVANPELAAKILGEN